MVDYVCLKCREEIPSEMLKKRIRCPYCGSKILLKQTKDIKRDVKAV